MDFREKDLEMALEKLHRVLRWRVMGSYQISQNVISIVIYLIQFSSKVSFENIRIFLWRRVVRQLVILCVTSYCK